eukprot:1136435-Pelagomonas_calceolata.AAC.9
MCVKCEFVELSDRTFGQEGGGRDRGQQSPYRLAPALHPLTFQFQALLMNMGSPDELMCHDRGLQVTF